MVRTGSSYASQSETTLTFGLGKPDGTDRAFTVEIAWPSGEKTTLRDVKANQSLAVREGQGITRAEPIVSSRAAPAAAPTPAPPAQGPAGE